MKWYYILLIAFIAIIIGFWLSRVRMNSEPIKANTKRIVEDLQSELDNINNWLSGRPNTEDPNYESTRIKYSSRRDEILSTLKNIYGCTLSININKGSQGEYIYTCVNN